MYELIVLVIIVLIFCLFYFIFYKSEHYTISMSLPKLSQEEKQTLVQQNTQYNQQTAIVNAIPYFIFIFCCCSLLYCSSSVCGYYLLKQIK